jgi:hypothetical protein
MMPRRQFLEAAKQELIAFEKKEREFANHSAKSGLKNFAFQQNLKS